MQSSESDVLTLWLFALLKRKHVGVVMMTQTSKEKIHFGLQHDG